MRKVNVSKQVLDMIADLETYLKEELKYSKNSWIFAYEVFDGGVIVQDMAHGASLSG